MTSLDGRVALITGAAQGLGAAIAGRFREAGATVFITDVKREAGEALARQIGASFLVQNVAYESDWCQVVESIETSAQALHLLVNNAGIEGAGDAPKDPEHAPLSDWQEIFDVNVTGTFLGCKACLPLIARSGGGAIINLSSVASLVPTPFITAYGASKAAVEHLSKSIALYAARAGYRIRCNSVHPGQVRTPMLDGLFERMAQAAGTSLDDFAAKFRGEIPLDEFQEPIDIANAVMFLASDESRYITGQSLAVDGGFTLAH
ncbi:MAG: SDR family oxidoreductase [Pseudomonadota bacterium]